MNNPKGFDFDRGTWSLPPSSYGRPIGAWVDGVWIQFRRPSRFYKKRRTRSMKGK